MQYDPGTYVVAAETMVDHIAFAIGAYSGINAYTSGHDASHNRHSTQYNYN